MSSDQSAPLIREIELPTPDGVLRGKVSVPGGPMRLPGLVGVAFAITNGLVDRGLRLETLNGRELSCRAGCGACCRHMVPVSPPEAFHLAELIERAPARDALRARFEAIGARLEAEGLVAELLDPPPTSDSSLPVARRYFALQMACPFLENESCGIHRDRPVVCRDYNVTSPPEWCQRPYDHDVQKVPMPLPLAVPLARATSRLAGVRPQLIPLTLAPSWAMEHAELGRRTWPGPEMLELLLEEIRASRAAQ
jgi:Fe-S-cluster containining protein